jgi:hypothetical protein
VKECPKGSTELLKNNLGLWIIRLGLMQSSVLLKFLNCVTPGLIYNFRIRLDYSGRGMPDQLGQRDGRNPASVSPARKRVPQIVNGEIIDLRFLQC